MNRYRMQSPPRWWPPKMNPTMVRLLKPLQRRKRARDEQLVEVTIRGAELVRSAIDAGHGVLITPNHPTHADSYAIYESAYEVGCPYYIVAAWQVFDMKGWLAQRVIQWHGCFSIDREGTDMKAFKQAVDVLQNRPNPLVIFPEGEVYHCNDRVTPFREGAAAIALTAAKRADREVVCVPCALKYEYLDDPTNGLLELMEELERQIFWRPRQDQPLPDRLYKFAEAIMSLKEAEYLGHTRTGRLPERTNFLATKLLGQLEKRYEIDPRDERIPERVKELRRVIIKLLEETAPGSDDHQTLHNDLDDVFLVVQLYSYPGDYVAENPTTERIAESLDKFEEDVLQRYTATIRGSRRATVTFGEPVTAEAGRRKGAAHELTNTLESRVQSLLDHADEANPPI